MDVKCGRCARIFYVVSQGEDSMNKTCARCAEPLMCSANAQCWCMAYPPIFGTAVRVEAADDCVCSACLAAAIQSLSDNEGGATV